MSAYAILAVTHALVQTPQPPVVEFPEAGLDDPASYEGYATRFFRDTQANTLQIYIDTRSGRVVHLWADAANESAAFTVRDTTGQPGAVAWGAPNATATQRNGARSVQHRLTSSARALDIGWFLLGSMRQERDFQYSDAHRRPYSEPPFVLQELTGLITGLERLPAAERTRHLAALGARTVQDVRGRLEPRIALEQSAAAWTLRVEQVTLDGKNHLTLELSGAVRESSARLNGRVLSVRASAASPVSFDVTVTTDAPALSPLSGDALFNDAFRQFHARQRAVYDSLRRSVDAHDERLLSFRRLDREARGLELLSSEEKLMAGLPNYATYFGRDMMMAALMLEPIVSVDVQEHVIASVLRKLSPTGEVSHEEALGGQAIREHAAQYSALVQQWQDASARGDSAVASRSLTQAASLLTDLQTVRENYRMIDDDFQLPVLVGRYLSRTDVPADRRRRFLSEAGPDGVSRARLLIRNLGFVAELARPYVQQPTATNLVGFLHRDARGWEPGSWRDSRVGYANGRFAMDVNVVWVPKALEALPTILQATGDIGELRAQIAALPQYVRDSAGLRSAIETWKGARRHFEVQLSPEQIRTHVNAMLDGWPGVEAAYWRSRFARSDADDDSLAFLALALDSTGSPIRVANTDPATELFLERENADPAALRQMLDVFLREYPVGLFVDSLGPLVANDAYASSDVQERFRIDLYHSPRVVWGREVNLIFLGLLQQILAAQGQGTAQLSELHGALEEIRGAVEASGLRHAELWSYRIDAGRLRPIRYGSSTDIQLWNVTDLAVRFLLAQLPQR